MSEFERWRDSLGVKYPPSEQIIMEWAFKAGYEAGLRRAGEICQLYAGDQRRHSLCTSAAFKCKDAILAEIKGE